MHGHQFKRERPSFRTAHEYYREGSFLIDPKQHYLSGKKREKELERVTDELREIAKTQFQFPRTQNLEYAILRRF